MSHRVRFDLALEHCYGGLSKHRRMSKDQYEFTPRDEMAWYAVNGEFGKAALALVQQSEIRIEHNEALEYLWNWIHPRDLIHRWKQTLRGESINDLDGENHACDLQPSFLAWARKQSQPMRYSGLYDYIADRQGRPVADLIARFVSPFTRTKAAALEYKRKR